jgi:hypothetical protein
VVAHCPANLRRHHRSGVHRIPFRLQLFSTNPDEVSLTNEHGSQDELPQLDEAVWKAWVQKNEAKDRIRSARRPKILGFVVILGAILMIVWRSTI